MTDGSVVLTRLSIFWCIVDITVLGSAQWLILIMGPEASDPMNVTHRLRRFLGAKWDAVELPS